MQFMTVGLGIAKRDWRHPLAAVLAVLWVSVHPRHIWRRRLMTQRIRRLSDRGITAGVYPGSVVLARFVRRIRTAARLMDAESQETCADRRSDAATEAAS